MCRIGIVDVGWRRAPALQWTIDLDEIEMLMLSTCNDPEGLIMHWLRVHPIMPACL